MEAEHVAKVLGDKCLSAKLLRCMFIDEFNENGHPHEEKHVKYFPEEVFYSEIGDENVILIPIEKIRGKDTRSTIPIFMLELSYEQKREIIDLGQKNGLSLCMKSFLKPKIFIRQKDVILAEED